MFRKFVHRFMLDFIQIYCMIACEKLFKILSTLINYIHSKLSLYIHQIHFWIIFLDLPSQVMKESD
jgi:hypothetical protein